jgi:hypothetical protein
MKYRNDDEIHEGPYGVRLVININDPDTPAIIEWKGATATYDCGMDNAELDGGREFIGLMREQLDWLEQFKDEVDEAYSIARAGMKEYGN